MSSERLLGRTFLSGSCIFRLAWFPALNSIKLFDQAILLTNPGLIDMRIARNRFHDFSASKGVEKISEATIGSRKLLQYPDNYCRF
jgi:hypothetical protein